MLQQTKTGHQPKQTRASEKLISLEKNIQSLLASNMDENNKRLVISILWDYKNDLLKRLSLEIQD